MTSALLVFLVACGTPQEPAAPAPEPAPVAVPAAPTTPSSTSGVGWSAPDEATIPEGPYGDSIRRGMDLFVRTNVLLPEYAPGNITCSNCHLEKGRAAYAVPMVGAQSRYPKYMDRTGAVIGLPDRIDYCFTRSLAGSRLPHESQEMTDLVAYIAWLSQGVPVGAHIEGETLPPMEEVLVGDAARGEALYTEKLCVTCHQPEGGGVAGAFPALWGPGSYSIGASMAREERAASFIRRFMPQTAPGSLTAQEAYDLSAFINSKPRPDSPAKELDFPDGGAPKDVPYATAGREAYKPPASLIERPNPHLAVVPIPPSAKSLFPKDLL